MMLRTRFANGKIYGETYLKIDWDDKTYINSYEHWDLVLHGPSRLYPQTIDSMVTDELWDWLPEQ